MKRHAISFTIVFLLSPWLASFSSLEAQTEFFFKGKTIKIIGGSGGFYERWARLLGRHMGKHIPGNPSIIVQPKEVNDRVRKLLGN